MKHLVKQHIPILKNTEVELEMVCDLAKQKGVFDAVICTHWAHGGPGAKELAFAVERACQTTSSLK